MGLNEGNERWVIFANGRKVPLTHRELHAIIRSRWMYGAAIISCFVWVGVALQLGIGWVSLVRESQAAIIFASLGTLGVTVAVYFGGLTLLLVALPPKTSIFEPGLSAVTMGLSIVFGYGIATILGDTDVVLHQLSSNFWGELALFFVAMQIVILSYPLFYRDKLLASLSDQSEALKTHEEPQLRGKRVNLGHIETPAEELVCLTAKGHYVQIITTSSNLEVRATLSSILPLLPEDLGALVHRSHWICKYAIQSAETNEGKLLLTLNNGDVLPVARSRKTETKSWLSELGITVK